MRSRIWALAIALVGSSAFAAAPVPLAPDAVPPVVLPKAIVPPVEPSPMPIPVALPSLAAAAPVFTVPAANCAPVAPVVAQGQGCSSCDSKAAAKSPSLFGNLRIGAGTAMPVGCSCPQAEKTFFFGSCNQFFTPGNLCGPRTGRCSSCGLQTGGATGATPCHTGGGSYLNR